MPETAQTGRTTEIASRSPNLAECLASSALKYGTARPGFAKRVEPGLLFATRVGRLSCRLLFATSPQLSYPPPFVSLARAIGPGIPKTANFAVLKWNPDVGLTVRKRTVLFRSRPEINS